MSSPRTLLRAVLVIGATLALSAAATSAEESLDLRYSMSLGTLGSADLALRYEENGEGYRSELSARARGVAHLLSRYQSAAASEGQGTAEGDGGPLAAVSYRWASDQRERSRTIEVVFDPESGDVVEMEMKKNGEPRETEVPPELQVGVVDPLTAIFSLRRQTAEALAGNGPERFGVSVFDGRRRYDIEAEILGRDRATIDGEKRPIIEVNLSLRPLAGFDEHDLQQIPGEDGYVRVQLSDDDRLVPLDVRTYGAPVPTRLQLVKDCSMDDRRCGPIPTN